ncbi:MAG: 50S ribosomal protein L6 [Pirellulaceae bacterium]|jgi:large subunit ribosomal protein L6
MSRIGKQPVPVLDGVKVSIDGCTITTEGPQGKLQFEHRPEISLEIDEENKQILVSRGNDERMSRALHGLTRSLINNMVVGVKEGYEKRLEIVGVGYGGTVQENQLALRVGFANEIKKAIPSGLDVTCPDQNHVVIKGCDKQQVGQFAAEVRAVRKPEPYKGKGIRYDGEYVKIKPGKTAV